ncbi:hypothetical protein SAMN05444722_3803 [Rhodovulum sp. ES.010]|uniref:hypothetical protein n=1 Tax=Rhodovulum sp. ES.010 TaxID=1882821 RepID=UPI000928D1E6|nr:hypothetical protein [Rhodovulum sp. ES.010]SIO59926.1 hypothetical protein SAMN05444722_3803 [Rhodovulum sp. ES.010]
MKNERAPSKTLEETAADAIRLGREVALLARTLRPGCDAREVEFLERCLAPLRDGRVFDRLHEGGFEAAVARLRVLRDAEELGRRREFIGFDDPEGDAVGVIQEVVEYSDRGRALAGLVDRFEAFLAFRQDVFDRIKAERFVLGLN